MAAAVGLVGGVVSASLLSAGAASAATAVAVPCSGSGGGASGLVAAIKAANAHGGGTIGLAAACTYTLSTRDNGTDGGNGLPVITSPITLSGHSTTTIARNTAPTTAAFRIFDVATSGRLTLNTLTVTGGKAGPIPGFDNAVGGAILAKAGTVQLLSVRVSGNTARDEGGGILGAAGATVSLVNSQVSNNTAPSRGFAEEDIFGGGGIAVDNSTLNLTSSRVIQNSADDAGGGILTNGCAPIGATTPPCKSGSIIIRSSLVDNNLGGDGGGILNGFRGPANLVISSTQVTHNRALDGGGIEHDSGQATLTSSLVSGNTLMDPSGVAVGGGIYNLATLTLINTPVVNNTAAATGVAAGPAEGGGILNGSRAKLTLTSSPVSNNTASAPGGPADGGGIFNDDLAVVTMTNGTVTGNTASGPGGPADGGGIFNTDAGVVSLTSTDVTNNTATGAVPAGGGIFNNGKVTLNKSLVTGNHPNNCRPPGRVAGCTN
jgi:hypothetical protein